MRTDRSTGLRPRRFGVAPWAAGIAVIAAVIAAAAVAKPGAGPASPRSLAVTTKPIASFSKLDPGATRFGQLDWLGGLVISSDSTDFGGISGLLVDRQGQRFLAVSDAGRWFTGAFVTDGDRLAGVSDVRMGALLDGSGRLLGKKSLVDAEGLALHSGSLDRGQVYVSFERRHRIGLYRVDAEGVHALVRTVPVPSAAKSMTRNEGFEAIALAAVGRRRGVLVALSENFPSPSGQHTGWMWTGGKPQAFYLTNPGDFGVTDAAPLEGGGLLVLERRFRWLEGVRMRLRYVSAAELVPGKTSDGLVLLEADQRFEIDNMEAVAVSPGAGGRMIITLMSDDNFNRQLQRTIALRFSWEGPTRSVAPPPR